MSLYATDAGAALMLDAEKVATQLEEEQTRRLTATERKTLMRLLQKIYLSSFARYQCSSNSSGNA